MVPTVRALPDKLSTFVFFNLNLSIITTDFTVVTLCIQFCIHNMLVDELHHRKDCRNVLLHIRDFNIADCSSWRQFLELCLELQLVKCIDWLRYMYMITVRNIILICNSFDDSESLLKTFCKLVCGRLHRCTIYRIADILSSFPLGTFVIQPLHNCHCKWSGFRICMRLSKHAHAHLIKACISKRNG